MTKQNILDKLNDSPDNTFTLSNGLVFTQDKDNGTIYVERDDVSGFIISTKDLDGFYISTGYNPFTEKNRQERVVKFLIDYAEYCGIEYTPLERVTVIKKEGDNVVFEPQEENENKIKLLKENNLRLNTQIDVYKNIVETRDLTLPTQY